MSHDEYKRETVVNVLMAEYNNIHGRVLRQSDSHESTIIKILMLIGVLFYFGIKEFHIENPFIANFIFISLIPLITIASVVITAANAVKVMILGDYLKLIENKVNKVLADEAEYFNFPKKHVLGWEYWRVRHGNMNKNNAWSEITLSFFLVITFNIAMIICYCMRMQYLCTYNAGKNLGWWILSFIELLLLIGSYTYSYRKVVSWQQKNKEYADNDDLEYSYKGC